MSAGLWLLLDGEKLSLRAQPRRASLGVLCLLLALYQFGLTFFGGSYTAYGYGMMAFAFFFRPCAWPLTARPIICLFTWRCR